jgi:hypothetical protein
MRAVKNLPSVSLYIRITDEKGRRLYERIRRRNPQICGPSDVYCIHFYENGKRRWLSVGTDLNAANAARHQKEQELLLPKKEEAAWRLGETSVVLRTFLDFLSANADAIRAKAELALSSIARIKS